MPDDRERVRLTLAKSDVVKAIKALEFQADYNAHEGGGDIYGERDVAARLHAALNRRRSKHKKGEA